MMANTSTCNLCTGFLKDLKEPYWRYQNKYGITESNVFKFANKKGNFDQNRLGLSLHNSLASPYFTLKLQEAM